MLIMGIETSCDETSVALVKDGKEEILNLVASQMDIHGEFGGVVPELACRRHIEVLNPMIEKALKRGKIKWEDIDAVAVTCGPGLVGALLIGVAVAKALAFSLNIPLIGVNHLEGHIYANMLQEGNIPFPSVVLLVSGGHTSLILVEGHGKYKVLGSTRDDACGEAFDKVARMLNLGYPGGPVIDKISKKGNPKKIPFPRAMMEDKENFDFSFSGLKTSVVYFLRSHKREEFSIEDVAASFQEAVVDVLVEKSIRATKKYKVSHILVGGGVGRNSRLREKLTLRCQKENITLHLPHPKYCTDNAAMIASAGYFLYKRGVVSDFTLDAYPNLTLTQKI